MASAQKCMQYSNIQRPVIKISRLRYQYLLLQKSVVVGRGGGGDGTVKFSTVYKQNLKTKKNLGKTGQGLFLSLSENL
jgi:hypothetical protein